ncbi:hypothetical protein [Flagellimonas sp.]|uniref:hypothetical protein n=1 Tax=Flagellimonas sp. TaxID=2058762 RepID=UPI003B5918B8
MKKTLMLFSSLVILATIAACSSDNEDDLTGTDDDPGNGEVTYTGNIRAIMTSSCVGCHSSPPTNGAPFSLTTFNDVQSRATGIIGAISKQAGEPRAMPPGGRLPQATIDLFQDWIDADTPQN